MQTTIFIKIKSGFPKTSVELHFRKPVPDPRITNQKLDGDDRCIDYLLHPKGNINLSVGEEIISKSCLLDVDRNISLASSANEIFIRLPSSL
jgi:hypothetical protein